MEAKVKKHTIGKVDGQNQTKFRTQDLQTPCT